MRLGSSEEPPCSSWELQQFCSVKQQSTRAGDSHSQLQMQHLWSGSVHKAAKCAEQTVGAPAVARHFRAALLMQPCLLCCGLTASPPLLRHLNSSSGPPEKESAIDSDSRPLNVGLHRSNMLLKQTAGHGSPGSCRRWPLTGFL